MSYSLGKHVMEKEAVLDVFARVGQLLMLSLEPSVPDNKSKDFIDAGKNWLANARQYIKGIEREYQKKKYTSIVIHDREIRRMMKQLKSAIPRVPRKSEPKN